MRVGHRSGDVPRCRRDQAESAVDAGVPRRPAGASADPSVGGRLNGMVRSVAIPIGPRGGLPSKCRRHRTSRWVHRYRFVSIRRTAQRFSSSRTPERLHSPTMKKLAAARRCRCRRAGRPSVSGDARRARTGGAGAAQPRAAVCDGHLLGQDIAGDPPRLPSQVIAREWCQRRHPNGRRPCRYGSSSRRQTGIRRSGPRCCRCTAAE